MARNITDAQRQVTVHFPERKINLKRLFINLILACVVIGGSVGGYYLYNEVTSTVNLPKPQVPPNVVAPTTPTETPTVQPMPVLEVAWEEIRLPALKYGYDDISGFLVENEGKTISVYRCIGPANNGMATLYSLWRTKDGGRTWNEVEQMIIGGNEKNPPGFIPGGYSISYDISPAMNEEESLQSTFNPLIAFYGKPWLTAQDGNNIFVAIRYRPYDPHSPYGKPYDVFRLLLSFDAGSSWNQLNFPGQFKTFDAYPETPQLTLLKENGTPKQDPHIRWIDIVSVKNNSIQIFMISGRGSFLRATIKSPN